MVDIVSGSGGSCWPEYYWRSELYPREGLSSDSYPAQTLSLSLASSSSMEEGACTCHESEVSVEDVVSF